VPVFTYEAADAKGRIVKGTMEAKDEGTVVSRLQSENIYPIRVSHETKKEGRFPSLSSPAEWFRGIGGKDVLNFTAQLSTLISSGLTIDRSLSILIELSEKPKFSEMVEGLRKQIQGGASLADAMGKYPRVFPRLYVSMVRAGEIGGALDVILKRLAEFLESSQRLRDNIRSALVYPVLLTVVGGAAVAVLLTFVIPKFAQIFEDMGQTLPLPTLILLTVSSGVTRYWWAILAALALAGWGFRWHIRTESGRDWWDRLKLTAPLVGTLIRKIEVSRFTRTLGTLLGSGVPVLQSITIVRETMDNSVVSREIEVARKKIKEGSGIADPLRTCEFVPPLAIHMITVGEETGKLEEMLIRVADIYDNDVQNSLKGLISLLEPTMILLMGALVGFIVISMLMAIFSINTMQF
jgi:general secretion pathway protein F